MMNVIFAVLVLGVIAVVFGLILSVAAKAFEVKVDERLPKIQACLAGANCGGCGYPGCGGCAEAILAGKAPVTACAPLGVLAGDLQLLADSGEQEDGQQEAQTAGDTVDHRLNEVVAVLHVQQHNAQNCAVGGDQGQIHAQSGIQSGHGLLEEHLDELHQRSDDQNECHGLHVSQIQRDQDVLVHHKAHGGGQTHNEGNGHAHAHCGIHLLRNTQEGAAAQELGEDEVVCQDCAQRDRKQLKDFHYLLSSLSFLGRARAHCMAAIRAASTRKPPTGRVSIPIP